MLARLVSGELQHDASDAFVVRSPLSFVRSFAEEVKLLLLLLLSGQVRPSREGRKGGRTGSKVRAEEGSFTPDQQGSDRKFFDMPKFVIWHNIHHIRL